MKTQPAGTSYYFETAKNRTARYCPNYCGKCRCAFFDDLIKPLFTRRGVLDPDMDSMQRQLSQSQEWQGHLADELKGIPIAEFIEVPDWFLHIRLTLQLIPDRADSVLMHWFTTLDGNRQIAGFLMEKISISADVKKAWLEKMPELQTVLDQDAQASRHRMAHEKRRAIRAKTNRFISSQRLQADTPEIRQQIIDQLERDLEC